MTTCRLCRRDAATSSRLCEHHLAAMRNLEAAYKRWDEAYGGMTWRDYLKTVREKRETGQWAKEVAELLLKEPAGALA